MTDSRGAQEDRIRVDRVLGGDTAAFAEIVQRWQGPLINMAWRFCHDRSRAEDMAQDAFLRAFRYLGQCRDEAKFSTWLFALAANVYRTELRRLPATTLSLDDIAEIAAPGTIANQMEDADQAEVIRYAVQALPEKYRDAVVLYYFHEQDVSSTALTLGIPEGTVKTRLSRGRDLLRKKFLRGKGKSNQQ